MSGTAGNAMILRTSKRQTQHSECDELVMLQDDCSTIPALMTRGKMHVTFRALYWPGFQESLRRGQRWHVSAPADHPELSGDSVAKFSGQSEIKRLTAAFS